VKKREGKFEECVHKSRGIQKKEHLKEKLIINRKRLAD
jgi:hypothetical protein